MSQAPLTDPGPHAGYRKSAGDEPLPGYVLLHPLGKGGFGEVWKCVAPGGLHKAVKFVPPTNDGNQLRQEFAAFEQIKAIRHPFLLTLERVELVADELVMVMELADRQLADRFRECADGGLPGVPRDELLGYLADAAEALDMIAARYGLQHLDVKPANLFLTAGRVKVGDYGLVSRLGPATAAPDHNRGLTPKYVAPEVLHGRPSPHSDQYSLALVYCELLTGGFPYPARSPQQLMLMHLTAAPNLDRLPEADRPAVARALAKEPDDRYGYCLEFVRTLMTAGGADAGSDLAFRRARLGRTTPDLLVTPPPAGTPRPAGPGSNTGPHPGRAELTQDVTLPAVARQTSPARPLPPLSTVRARPAATPRPAPAVTPSPDDLPLADADPGRVVLDPIRSVVPVGRLLGGAGRAATPPAADLIQAVVDAAAGGARIPQLPGDLGMLADGTWVVQFPSTVPAQVAPLKLEVVRAYWGMTLDQPDLGTVLLRKGAPGSLWGSFTGRARGALEVEVRLPKPNRPLGEVTARGAVTGPATPEFTRSALDAIPKVLVDVRRELSNVPDRRRFTRVTADFPVTLYPIHSDGGIDPPVPARTADVSVGGVCLVTRAALPTKHVFAAFDSVPAAAGLAVMLRLVRTRPDPTGERTYGAEFRTDL